jgi:hypothetical protein
MNKVVKVWSTGLNFHNTSQHNVEFRLRAMIRHQQTVHICWVQWQTESISFAALPLEILSK